MTGPVRLGVLGCADIARRRTLPAVRAVDGINLVAIASRDPHNAQAFASSFGCAAVTGYDTLLARNDIDAVYIPLPAMLHATWIERALVAGKHVLAEKPLSADLPTTLRLLDLARSTGRVLVENFMFPHHSQLARIKELLSSLGTLRTFSSTFTIPPKPADDIRYLPAVGGGALLDVGVYPLRAALHFLGPDLTVTGAVLRVDATRKVTLSGSVLLHRTDGTAAHLTFGMEHAYRAAYDFTGTHGILTAEHVFTPPPSHHPALTLTQDGHRKELTLPADDQAASTVRWFTTAVTGRHTDHGHTHTVHLARLVGQIEEQAKTTLVA
ncbi:Gfo/Idh/MocA family oxidoreductase [Streptomyces marokkonensis]|uniref:Gfo/Idh/MocA family oxidoreductase n=1 Tax=Streptomyces marokkonensis TaxID=324855 RepID=A0ABP7RP82_9ACTN